MAVLSENMEWWRPRHVLLKAMRPRCLAAQ